MANEITINYRLRMSKAGVNFDSTNQQLQRDMSGSRRAGQTQNIGTTKEVLITGDLATAGYGVFKNLDATNYVELGVVAAGTFYPLVKLLPGDVALFPLTTLSVYAQANTAAVDLDYAIVER